MIPIYPIYDLKGFQHNQDPPWIPHISIFSDILAIEWILIAYIFTPTFVTPVLWGKTMPTSAKYTRHLLEYFKLTIH